MIDQEWKLPLLNNYIEKWAKETPDKTAIIQYEDDRVLTYKKLLSLSDFFALRLLDMGIEKGDIVATQLVLFPEHSALMFACLKIGAVFAPLDLRLKKEEVRRDLDKIKPKIFVFHGKTPQINFNEIGKYIRKNCDYIEHFVQVLANPDQDGTIEGAITIQEMMSKPKLIWLKIKDIFSGGLSRAYKNVSTKTPAIIIFTTGTTGEPKPALMNHENVIVQNKILATGIRLESSDKILVNLPPSHVGCITETMMTMFFLGGTAVFLKIFNVAASLKAIEKYKITVLGQIPTQFRMMWNEPDYSEYDLSSLRYAVYAGSAVDVEFLKKLETMAPNIGTGLGMTETAGFVTFTPYDISVEEMAGQVGHSFDDLAKVSIRQPMNKDGSAGEELPDGENGDICYHPPIVFMGYYNYPEATKKAISKEGILYSGDLGYFKDMGSYKALFLSGRAKFIIKQKGYQVFPDEVQSFIAEHPKVNQVNVVGVKHKLFDEGIFAFVKSEKDVAVTSEELMDFCKNIAAYKRPQHIEIWPEDKPFPLTRTTKVDKIELIKEAQKIVDELRKKGQWDM